MLFKRDHALEALGRVLIKKGIITEAEVLAELEEVKKEIRESRKPIIRESRRVNNA